MWTFTTRSLLYSLGFGMTVHNWGEYAMGGRSMGYPTRIPSITITFARHKEISLTDYFH